MMKVYLQDQLSIKKDLEREYLKQKMAQYIWAISKMTYLMDLELSTFLTVKNIKVNLTKERNMELATIFIKMVTITKGLLSII